MALLSTMQIETAVSTAEQCKLVQPFVCKVLRMRLEITQTPVSSRFREPVRAECGAVLAAAWRCQYQNRLRSVRQFCCCIEKEGATLMFVNVDL